MCNTDENASSGNVQRLRNRFADCRAFDRCRRYIRRDSSWQVYYGNEFRRFYVHYTVDHDSDSDYEVDDYSDCWSWRDSNYNEYGYGYTDTDDNNDGPRADGDSDGHGHWNGRSFRDNNDRRSSSAFRLPSLIRSA